MTSIGLPPLRLRHDTGSRCRLDAYKYNGSEFVEDTAMSSTFDEEPRRQPEGWPPTHHESLQHMPVHTPMQVNGRCSESSGSPLYPHPLAATGRWLHHPVPGFPQIPQPPSPFFHHLPTSQAPPPFAFIHEEANKKVAEWHAANNNSTLGQQIWQKQARELEEQRKKSIENGKKSPPAYLIETIPLPTQVSPPANKADLIAPKAIHGDTRRLLEPSSSLSPEETKSNGQPSFAGSHSATDSDEDGHRMEVDPPNGATSPQRPTGTREEPTLASQTLPFLALPPLPPRPASCNPKVSTSLPKRDEPVDSNANKQLESREDDPSSLLLNFSNQSFINRAASPIRQTIISHPKPTPPKPIPFPATNGTPHKFQCALCPFSCASKFHFNSHMNTHGDHQCKMCDYISRTEGRLKKHMRESHSAEERAAKGIELQPAKEPKEHKEHKIEHHPPALSLSLNLGSTLSQSLGLGPLQLARPLSPTPPATLRLNGFPLIDAENNHLQTTMASLMEAVNKAVNSQAGPSTIANGQPVTSLAAVLGLDRILGNLGLPTGDGESLMTPIPSALDQIRAFTENPALLPDSPTLANALGAVSQVINMSSPEKADDPSKPAGSARSRSSKQKVYKCKQCPHTDTNKDDHWAHARTHIPADKQMNCPQCMFVTEYKHHLEYHIRNHIGSKPFRCEKCAYMCVNKSMLNSHMKSHNNVYQFRCADCTYATKYCHSLKQHLKKYGHRKRSDEGDHSQTPQSIGSVDSAFQRLTESVGLNIGGPLELKPPLPPTTLAQSLGLGSPFSPPHGLNYPGSQPGPLNLLLRQNPLQLDQLPGLLPGLPPPNVPLKCTVCEFSTGSQEDMIRHNMTHLNLNLLAQVSQSNSVPLPPFLSSLQLPPLPPLHPPNSHDSGIDVVKEESDGHEMTPEHEIGESSGCSSSPMGSSGEEEGRDGEGKRKRKMRKLEEISARLSQGKSPSQRSDDSSAQDNNNDDDALVAEPSSSPSDVHVDSLQRTPPAIAHPMPTLPNVEGPLSIYQQALLAHISSMQMKRDEENQAFRFMCPHCKMAFADQSLYHIHMGYHGYEHVFQCQRCGHHAHDPLNFNLHLLQASHQ